MVLLISSCSSSSDATVWSYLQHPKQQQRLGKVVRSSWLYITYLQCLYLHRAIGIGDYALRVYNTYVSDLPPQGVGGYLLLANAHACPHWDSLLSRIYRLCKYIVGCIPKTIGDFEIPESFGWKITAEICAGCFKLRLALISGWRHK